MSDDIKVGQQWTCKPPDYARTVEITELSGDLAYATRIGSGSHRKTKLAKP